MSRALEILPEVEVLAPLRESLLDGSEPDTSSRWASSYEYRTLETRLADLDMVEAAVPRLAEAARERAEQILGHATRALRAAEAGEHADAATALVRAGEVEEEGRRFDSATRFYQKAADLGRKPRDRRSEGLALRRLARVARAQGRLPEARSLYRRGFDIAEAQGDVEGMVVGCQGLGNVYVDQGLWEPAREWYARGIELVEAEPPTAAYIHLCNGMSVVERRLGRLEESERWLRAGEQAAEAVGDSNALGHIQNARARLSLARGEWERAELELRRALAQQLDSYARTTVTLNLAEPLLHQGRLKEAAAVARQAEELAIRNGFAVALPEVYRTLGAIARARGDADGFVFFEQALDVCRRYDLPLVEVAQSQQQYAAFEAGLGEVAPAIARLEGALAIYREMGASLEEAEVAAELERLRASGR